MRKLIAITGVALLASALLIGKATAGRVIGDGVHSDTVLAHGTDVYTERFEGGEEALVLAKGDGDIDLNVYDADGCRVAYDHDSDNCPVVRWTPSRTGTYRIKVKNCEAYDVDYTIGFN